MVEDLLDEVVDPTIQKQEAANRFAANALIPPKELNIFVRSSQFSNENVKSFAEKIGVNPRIVMARLQHDEILNPSSGNRHKKADDFDFKS